MLLNDVLRKENNNLDIFRLIAALMVIYGHAYALLPTPGVDDPLAAVLVHDYSGSLAVKIFFFFSGLVVTNSLIEKRSFLKFIISRIFRIWPALILVLATSSLMLGPLLTSIPLHTYFANETVYSYIYRGIYLDIQFYLPGVFDSNARHVINGSLWTIPCEVFAYLVLAASYITKLLNSRIAASLFFVIVLIDPLIGNKILFTWLSDNHELTLLAPCFAFGSLLAIWKEKMLRQ